MSESKPDPKKELPRWLEFEHAVADLFRLFGYDEVIHDTKIEGGQCDVFATSKKRDKTSIVAECKYHEKASLKVNINEVQSFIYKVSNYRNSGKIDKGYMVTNTGFTSDARAAITEQTANYVFLVTYDELLQSLLDVHNYLKEFINSYNTDGEKEKYVDLKLINTTLLDQTILDGLPGDIIKIEETNQSCLIVPHSLVEKEREDLTFLDYSSGKFNPTVDPLAFVEKLKEYQGLQYKATKDFEVKLLQALGESVTEVATKLKDELVINLFEVLPQDILKMVSWSAEHVVTALLDKWKEYGGDLHLKTFRKNDFRKQIQRDILKIYKQKENSVHLEKVELPQFISAFRAYILEALKIFPGNMDNILFFERREIWTTINEFDNIIKHLETKPDEIPKVQLLLEQDAIASIERYIDSESTNTLVLIGDYGAGKTTVLRRLMNRLAENKLLKLDSPSCRIPLYITLKDFNQAANMETLIRSFLQNVVEMDNVSIRTFKKLNEEGRFILLLDAFDEMLTRITKADRRRCFREISELVSPNSKIILTGRPAYFNDFKELKENLELLQKKFTRNDMEVVNSYEIMCLQLMEEEEVEQFLEKMSPMESKSILKILINKPNLMDLARRPVLASMIAQTGEELIKLQNQKVTARSIYEIYTNKWIQREEDKGEFRLLSDPDQKSTFVRYLAMQMHISGSLTIHFADLDKSVEQYFELSNKEKDYFINEIRTCSFLSRTDDGYYFFIHKSFMEYFVACEFEHGANSPFADKFLNPLTTEIIDLLEIDNLPARMKKIWLKKDHFEGFMKSIRLEKDRIVRTQKFEEAASLRNLERLIQETIEEYNSIFTMVPNSKDVMYKLEEQLNEIDGYLSTDYEVFADIKAFIKDLNAKS